MLDPLQNGDPQERFSDNAEVELRLHREASAIQRRQRIADRMIVAVGRAVLIVLVLAGWALASGRLVDAETISNPASVLFALNQLIATGRIWPELWQTIAEVFTGYIAGATAGATLAFLLTIVPNAERVTRPFLLAVYSIPKIALAPLIVMWFGLGIAPKMILAAMFAFFIVFMNAVAGIQNVNRQLIMVVRVMGAGRLATIRKIVLPTMLPFLLLGLRLSIPEAMTGAVIGEFISARHGLGYLIYSASNEMNTAVSMAAIIVLVFVVAVSDVALGMIERMLPWRPRTRQTMRAGAYAR